MMTMSHAMQMPFPVNKNQEQKSRKKNEKKKMKKKKKIKANQPDSHTGQQHVHATDPSEHNARKCVGMRQNLTYRSNASPLRIR